MLYTHNRMPQSSDNEWNSAVGISKDDFLEHTLGEKGKKQVTGKGSHCNSTDAKFKAYKVKLRID